MGFAELANDDVSDGGTCRRELFFPVDELQLCVNAHVDCVNRVYTDLAVFDIRRDGVIIRETFGISAEELERRLQLTFQR